jgi:LPXTG-motif cell wall-anchored protein
MVGVLSGIFFITPSMTGNVIANLTTQTTSLIGAGLLIVGLVAGLFWLKGRK